MAHICMIIICITAHQRVIADYLPPISVNVWPYQCMSGKQSMCVSMYYIQSFFFSFYYSNNFYCIFSGQINHLYDI